MYQIKDIIQIAEKLAPDNLAYDWDNVGLQIGSVDNLVDSILFTLDINKKVIEEAISKKCQLIISHHPLIFKPINKISASNYKGKLIYKIIKNNLNIYVMHTNLDIAPEGLNDYFARILDLKDTEILDIIIEENDKRYGLGKIGKIKDELKLRELINILKDKLGIEQELAVVGNLNKKIKKIAICTGSGGDLISLAAQKGADLFITGDIKYHQAQLAEQLGMLLIDAGHYYTEAIVKKLFYDYFAKKTKNIDLNISELNTNSFWYFK